MPKEKKPCLYCHRNFAIRKQWATPEQWASIEYCSKLCAKRAKEERVANKNLDKDRAH